jgi:hypothetical protein
MALGGIINQAGIINESATTDSFRAYNVWCGYRNSLQGTAFCLSVALAPASFMKRSLLFTDRKKDVAVFHGFLNLHLISMGLDSSEKSGE